MDQSEFRGYVFALLFYKRINDVYLENVAALEKELGDAELAIDPRMHDFVVPEDRAWEKVARTSADAIATVLAGGLADMKSIVINGDVADIRLFSVEQTMTQLEAFIEELMESQNEQTTLCRG